MAERNGLQLKYFVLNPTKDGAYGLASRQALLAYAKAIEEENNDLAYDLRIWEIGCRHNIAETKILKEAKADV